jgi:hypothetical protein
MARFKSCPLLEDFQQQKVSISYYTDSRQFIYPEVLVLSVTTDNTTISSQDFIQIYQQQRSNFLMYLFFMVLIPNLLVINLFWRDHQYQQSQNFSLSTSKHLALITISIHTFSAPKPMELMHFLCAINMHFLTKSLHKLT